MTGCFVEDKTENYCAIVTKFTEGKKETYTSKNPLKAIYQNALFMPAKAKLDLDNVTLVTRPDLLSLSPYLHTYLVQAYGKTKVGPEGEYYLKGTIKVIKEVPYSLVSELRRKARAMLSGSKDIEYSFSELFAGNIGEKNDGVCNIGNGNKGLYNQGLDNYGIYNKGCAVMGCFNTTREAFYMFNKPVKGLDWRKVADLLPTFLQRQFRYGEPVFGDTDRKNYEVLSVREAFDIASQQADWNEELEKLYALPNFDFAVFEEITGISKEMLDVSYDNWKKKFGKKGKKRK